MAMTLEYRFRLRNAANSADVLTVTSVRGGTNPYISAPPTGDAQTIDPRTGESFFGVYTGNFIDAPIGGSQRLLTSLLEDAGGRQQLGYRIAYWEFRENGGSWNVLIAGPVTGIKFHSDIECAVTVSDPMQAQTVKKMFSPSSETDILDFLADWPMRGCLLGGPVKGSSRTVFGISDLGGWTMRVEALPTSGQYGLQPVTVYGPPRWVTDRTRVVDVQEDINDAAGAFQIPLTNGAQSEWDTIGHTELNAWAWRGLIVLIDGVPWKPLTVYDEDEAVAASVGRPMLVTGSARGAFAMKVISDGVKTLTNGALVRVRALTILPTESCPIYIVEHPIEILKTFWTSAGISFSTSACTTMKQLIGTDARYALRITSARELQSLVDAVCRPFGIGLRGNDSGEIEPFDATLGRSTTAPAVTITTADVEKGSVQAFNLNPAEAITSIVFRAKRYADQRAVQVRTYVGGAFPTARVMVNVVDGVHVSDVELTTINEESGALPYGDFEMSFDGMIMAASSYYATVHAFFIAIARRVFDRWGRGGIGAKMLLLRTGAGAGARVGDEILVNHPAVPNQNYRLGDNGAIAARAMQIVRRTVVPKGLDVDLVDSGLTGQPPATLPTVSIAASSDLPRTVAEVTITNAAVLNAAGIGVELVYAFGVTATRYTPVLAWAPGAVPTGTIRLPPVTAGSAVYVKGRSIQPGRRASNYGTADDVTLTSINAPTSLVATPNASDGSKCDLAWTTGSGSATDLVDVFVRLDGEAFADARLIATLAPGSTRYEIAGLDPGEDYIASVQHRDPNTLDVSAEADDAFTTSGSTVTLDPPTSPTPFSFVAYRLTTLKRGLGHNGLKNGRYGLAVVAAHIPGEIEIHEALETGVGAGTYGSFTVVGRVPAVSGDWTTWQGLAPNDGLRRQLKARHVRDGATASSFTSTVVATPWTHQPLPEYNVPAGQGTVEINSNGTWTWAIDGSSIVDHYKYAESASAQPSDADAAAGTTITGRQVTRSGGAALTFGQTIYVTAIAYDAAGNALPSLRLRGSYQTFTATKTTAYSPRWIIDTTFAGPKTFTYDVKGWVQNALISIFGELQLFSARVEIADGVTITAVALDVNDIVDPGTAPSTTAAHPITFGFQRLSGTSNSVSLVSQQDTRGAGVQSLSGVLSESTTGRSYVAAVELDGSANAGELQFGTLFVTTTIPDPSKTF